MKPTSDRTQLLVSSTDNVAPFIEYCEKRNIDWAASAMKLGLPVELMKEQSWLPTKEVMFFLSELQRAHNLQIGIEVGRWASLDQISGRLSEQIKGCQALKDGVHVLTNELTHFNNHVVIWTEHLDGSWWLCHRGGYRPSVNGFEHTEWFRTLALINFCRHFLGENWKPSKTKLMMQYREQASIPSQFLQPRIEYSHGYGAIAIDINDDFEALSPQESTHDWHVAILKLIRTYAVLPWFNIEWFAPMLGMTKRTLQRNLKKEGYVFKSLKEEARKQKAIELLNDTSLSIDDIAWQVGYTDLSNFNRAFRSWTGVSAPAYRRK
ncbi:helix-turn-helix domain-containing protein [Vibrio breoganii]